MTILLYGAYDTLSLSSLVQHALYDSTEYTPFGWSEFNNKNKCTFYDNK